MAAKKEGTQTVRRDAFPNSLCTHMVKRKLDIEYYSIATATGLRTGVSAAVRYTENKIRALMGIRSRLAVKDLPNDYRRIIDYYFDAIEKREQKKRERESAPEYMRLYDAPSAGLSFAGADEIERASWDTTARLVEGITEHNESPSHEMASGASAVSPAHADYPAHNPTAPATPVYAANSTVNAPATPAYVAPTPANHTDAENDVDTYGLSAEAISYLSHLCLGTEYTPTAIPTDTLAENINEAFADGFGDVIIEPSDDGYTVIEDYREDITEWLNKITK